MSEIDCEREFNRTSPIPPIRSASQSGYPAEFARPADGESEYSYKHPASAYWGSPDDDNAYLITKIGYFRTQDATTTSKDFPSFWTACGFDPATYLPTWYLPD